MARALPPVFFIAVAMACAFSPERLYVKATFAPSSASRFVMAAPMPRLPPVTRTVLFANFFMCYSLLFDEPKVARQHLYLHVLGALLGTNKKVKNEKKQFYQRFE